MYRSPALAGETSWTERFSRVWQSRVNDAEGATAAGLLISIEDLQECDEVVVENLTQALDSAGVSMVGIQTFWIEGDSAGELVERLMSLWRTAFGPRTFLGFQERYASLSLPRRQACFKKEFVLSACRQLPMADCRGMCALLGISSERYCDLGLGAVRRLLADGLASMPDGHESEQGRSGAGPDRHGPADGAGPAGGGAGGDHGSRGEGAGAEDGRGRALRGGHTVAEDRQRGTERPGLAARGVAHRGEGSLVHAIQEAERDAGILGGAGGIGDEDDENVGGDMQRPTGLSDEERREYDSLVMAFSRVWRPYIHIGGLQFARQVTRYRLDITTKEQLIGYLQVCNQEQKVIRQFLTRKGRDPESASSRVECRTGYDMLYTDPDRFVSSPYPPYERVTCAQILHWTRNGVDLQERISRALEKLSDDSGDAPLRSEIVSCGQHLILTCDSMHPAFWVGGDLAESLVRRLSLLFHIAEDVKRQDRPQAWQNTDLFLGNLGGSSAEANALLRRTKADSKK